MSFKGNRTRIVAAIVAVLGIVQQYAPQVVPPEYQGLVLMVIAIAMVLLRQVTTTAPGKKE